MVRPRICCFASAVLLMAVCISPVFAQPVPTRDSSSTHIFPAGGQRGTTVAVRVGAECIAPGTHFLLEGDKVSGGGELWERMAFTGEPSPRRKPTEVPITYPKEWVSQIDIAADASLGTAFWRLNSAQGGTASRPFVIGDLPEFIETESNSLPESAETVSLPVTINGQINGERDTDYFRFHLTAGQWAVMETVCRRIGSRLDPVIEVLRADGRPLDVEKMFLGEDPVLAFQSPDDSDYLLRITNISFHGDPAHVYRINLTSKPLPALVIPSSVPAGKESMLTVFGFPSEIMEQPLQTKVLVPQDARDEFRMAHDAFASPITILVDSLPDLQETELDGAAFVQELSWPIVVDASMHGPTDEDRYRLHVASGDRLAIECRAWPRTSSILPVLAMLTSDGRELARAQSVDTADGVVRIEWQAEADSDVELVVSDLGNTTGAGYRLRVDRGRPDFVLSIASDQFDVVQGSSAELSVNVRRAGGFDGEIELLVEGLPEEVTAEATKVAAGADQAKIKISAGEKARSATCTLRVRGRAMLDGNTMERMAACRHLGTDGEGHALRDSTLDRLHLTIRHRPVFRLYCAEAYQYAHRGSVYPYHMEIERLHGFAAPITLQLGDRQNRDLDGIEMLEVTIPADQLQVMLPIYLPETMHINIQSQSQLYCQGYASFEDEHGQRQSVLVVSEKRNMLRTLPPVAKLEVMDQQISASAGARATCRLRLERTSNFMGAVRIELVDAPAGIMAEPCALASGAEEVAANIQFPAQLAGAAPQQLRFRASGQMPSGSRFVSEATVDVVWTSER